MNTPVPCQLEPDLWFSDNRQQQTEAARRCQGCPLSRYTACREEGWNHEYGVWGGLTEVMRRRIDPKRYEAAVAAAELRSMEIDDSVVDIRGRAELARLADAGVTFDMDFGGGDALADVL